VAARSVPLLERHLVVSALVLFLADLAIIGHVGAAAKALGAADMSAGFVALCVETVLVAVVITALCWWRAVSIAPRSGASLGCCGCPQRCSWSCPSS
jgi:hypothetical protein